MSAKYCCSSGSAAHPTIRPSSTSGPRVSATTTGPGNEPVSSSRIVSFDTSSRRSMRSSFSVSYWSTSRNSTTLSFVNVPSTPSTLIGPVKPSRPATANGSSANTPSTARPPLCGYSSAITCPVDGNCGEIVMFDHGTAPVVPPGPLSNPYRPHDLQPVVGARDDARFVAGEVQVSRPARSGHPDASVVGGQLDPVAHEPAEPAGFRRCREGDEVAAWTVGAQQCRHPLDRLHDVRELRPILVEIVVEVVEALTQRPREPRRIDVVDRVGQRVDRRARPRRVGHRAA